MVSVLDFQSLILSSIPGVSWGYYHELLLLWSVITAVHVPVAGQFCISVGDSETNGLYYVQIYEPCHESYRNFPAFFYDLTYDGCYYAGDSQGGPERSRDPVIEGDYTQYAMDGLFDTEFTYTCTINLMMPIAEFTFLNCVVR